MTEHGGELLRDTLEELLDGCGVTHKGSGHLETTWRDVTDSGLYVVGDPFHKVAAVLVLDVEHLLVNLLHGDDHGTWQPLSSSDHGEDHRQPSCSWHQTSAGSAQAQ